MTKPSEYMEAFFGVELNQKFEDMINDLHEIEDGLKKFSTELDKLEQEMDPSEFREMRREGKALIFEYGQEIKDAWQFLDFYLKSDKNTNQITLERDAYMKIYQIYKWDGADVRDLNTWIKELKEICDYEEYGGAPLLGVNGICIIGHGSSSPKAIKNAIRVAGEFIKFRINDHITARIAECDITVNK